MIIDVHAHLGLDRTFDELFTEAELWEKVEKYNVDITILQPGTVHTVAEVIDQHDVIADLCRRHPGKFVGMANPNPHLRAAEYEKELTRCVEELGFVGVKIHPAAHGVNPSGKDGLHVFEVARGLNIPVMVHTGTGIPFACPAVAIPIAEQFPDVPIVLAHSGMMVLANETAIVLKHCPNVHTDLTWTMGVQIKQWVADFGAHRFMFGTDQPINCGPELTKIRESGLTEDAQEWILAKTAQKVFNLSTANG